MFLDIENTGTVINSELKDYIEQNYIGIGFSQIYISGFENEKKDVCHHIIYSGANLSPNTLCINISELNTNIINWLNSL
jgi:hypothetical protein